MLLISRWWIIRSVTREGCYKHHVTFLVSCLSVLPFVSCGSEYCRSAPTIDVGSVHRVRSSAHARIIPTHANKWLFGWFYSSAEEEYSTDAETTNVPEIHVIDESLRRTQMVKVLFYMRCITVVLLRPRAHITIIQLNLRLSALKGSWFSSNFSFTLSIDGYTPSFGEVPFTRGFWDYIWNEAWQLLWPPTMATGALEENAWVRRWKENTLDEG